MTLGDADDDIGIALDLLIRVIDDAFAETGFAKKNPNLLGMVYLAGSIERARRELDTIATALRTGLSIDLTTERF